MVFTHFIILVEIVTYVDNLSILDVIQPLFLQKYIITTDTYSGVNINKFNTNININEGRWTAVTLNIHGVVRMNIDVPLESLINL